VDNRLQITFEQQFVRILSDGEKNYEFSRKVWTQARQACQKYDCYKILGIADTTIQMGTWDAFSHADLFSELQIDNRYRIAWVELNPEAYQTTFFIETVLFNRGFSARLFLDEREALEWLLNDDAD